MIESITAAGRTDGQPPRAKGKNPNPCVPSQPSLNPCGSPPAYACTHTQGWLGSPRCRGEARRRAEERRGKASRLPGSCPGFPASACAAGGACQRGQDKGHRGRRPEAMSLAPPVSRGEAVHVPDAVPAMNLTPRDRWAYSAEGFLIYPA